MKKVFTSLFLPLALLVLCVLVLSNPGCGNRSANVAFSAELCVTNLTAIWWKLIRHMGDGDTFPATLAGLETVGAKPEWFICPGSTNVPASMASVEEWTDFIYVSGVSGASDLYIPLLISPPENHAGEFGIVVWRGGNADRLPPDQVRKLIDEPWARAMDTRPESIMADKKEIRLRVPKRFRDVYPRAYKSPDR
jgi:hypothetical protein